MEPFEDSLPEEQRGKQEQLTLLLRRAYRREQVLPANERQAAIRRVEERLARREAGTTLLVEQTSGSARGAFLPQSQRRARQKPSMRVLSIGAAIVVAGILIGSAVLLLVQHIHAPAGRIAMPGQASPTKTSSGMNIEWAGLEMSMKVTPGPYFLGEMLAVDLSLTNHTHPTLALGGFPGNIPACNVPSLALEQTGGTSPHFSLYEPKKFAVDCGDRGVGPQYHPALPPGQTVSAHISSVLASSGTITLTGAAFFYKPGDITKWQTRTGPLTGHLPALHVQVASQVPTERVLPFQQKDSEVIINVPAGTQLIARTNVLCQAPDLELPAGHDDWEALSTPMLQRPGCPDISGMPRGRWMIALWEYTIGTAGYAVVQRQVAG